MWSRSACIDRGSGWFRSCVAWCCGGVLLVVSSLLSYAGTHMTVIDSEQTEYLLHSGAILIDNRPPAKFRQGHLPGAVNLPFSNPGHPTNEMSREALVEAVGDNDVVVFYCSGMMRAYHALEQARQWGITAELYWYKNGFAEWYRLGKPVDR